MSLNDTEANKCNGIVGIGQYPMEPSHGVVVIITVEGLVVRPTSRRIAGKIMQRARDQTQIEGQPARGSQWAHCGECHQSGGL